eukprot:m.126745 g.126745  ORF g.126745 m.126745 type:complete len:63 (+) comp13842_c0_seq1:146-334(+)
MQPFGACQGMKCVPATKKVVSIVHMHKYSKCTRYLFVVIAVVIIFVVIFVVIVVVVEEALCT